MTPEQQREYREARETFQSEERTPEERQAAWERFSAMAQEFATAPMSEPTFRRTSRQSQ